MAAIGDGWATDAWIEVSWVTGAWLVGDLVLKVLRPFRALEIIITGISKVDNPRLYFNLEPVITTEESIWPIIWRRRRR